MIEIPITSKIRTVWSCGSRGENMTEWVRAHGGRLIYKIVRFEGGGEEILDYIEFAGDEDATAFKLKFNV